MKIELAHLFLAFGDFARGLSSKTGKLEELEGLFHSYGWDTYLEEPDFYKILSGLNIIQPLDQFLDQLEGIHLDFGNDLDISLSKLEAIIGTSRALLTAISNVSVQDLATLTEPFDQNEFWEDISAHLLDDLSEQYIKQYLPKLYLPLHLWGVIRYEPIPAQPPKIQYQRTVFDWTKFFSMLEDPTESLKRNFGWGISGEGFNHNLLLESLKKVLYGLGISASYYTPEDQLVDQGNGRFFIPRDSDTLDIPVFYRSSWLNAVIYEASITVVPVSKTSEHAPSGLLIVPVFRGGLKTEMKLNSHFNLSWHVQSAEGNPFSLLLFPEQVTLIGGQLAIGAEFAISSTNNKPWALFGKASSIQIELAGITLRCVVTGSVSDPELRLILTFQSAHPQTAGCRFKIGMGDSDGFIKDFLGETPIEFSFAPEVIWSSLHGIKINGSPTFDFPLPIQKRIGRLFIQQAHLFSVLESSHSFSFRTVLDAQGKLGPITFLLAGLGFDLNIKTYDRQSRDLSLANHDDLLLGNFGLSLNYAPPRGLGFHLDTPSIQGGGYLEFNPEKGEYIGAAELTVMDKITLKAIGIINTELPDGQSGYSFLLIITSDFEPIPLGFGFKLEGVGGLIGIHRRLDQEAILNSIKDITTDTILFPSDPLGNVHNIIAGWNGIMPIAQGSHSFGILGKLSWGSNKLITIKAGLLLETPAMNLAIIGTAKSEITRTNDKGETIPLLRLQIAFAARYRPEKALFGFDASLYESEILGNPLSGDAALRLRGGNDPYFMLAVGGKHPDFIPPAGLGLPKLNRIAVKLNPKLPGLDLDASFYCALTSNTIQFGASASASYSALGLSISGGVDFDALFQVRPLYFKARAQGWVEASVFGFSGGLRVKGNIEGPYPFRFSLYVTVHFWKWDKNFHIPPFKIGDSARPELPVIDVLPLLITALEDPRNWQPLVPERVNLLVSLRKEAEEITGEEDVEKEKTLRCHPLGGLAIDQGVVPLGVTIDKFGAFQPTGYKRFSIALADDSGGGMSTENREQYFAPDQFFELSEEARFNRPSYEKMPSGIHLVGSKLEIADKVLERSVVYQTLVYDGDRQSKPEKKADLNMDDGPFLHLARSNSVAGSSLGQKSDHRLTIRQPHRIRRESYVVVDQHTLANFENLRADSAAEAERLLVQTIKEKPWLDRQLQVVPIYETL